MFPNMLVRFSYRKGKRCCNCYTDTPPIITWGLREQYNGSHQYDTTQRQSYDKSLYVNCGNIVVVIGVPHIFSFVAFNVHCHYIFLFGYQSHIMVNTHYTTTTMVVSTIILEHTRERDHPQLTASLSS